MKISIPVRTYTKREEQAAAHLIDVLLENKLYGGDTREAVLTLVGALGELSSYRANDILAHNNEDCSCVEAKPL